MAGVIPGCIKRIAEGNITEDLVVKVGFSTQALQEGLWHAMLCSSRILLLDCVR